MSFGRIPGALLIVAVSCLQAASVQAAEPLADKVRGAIDKGVGYLKKKQENRGGGGGWNWENSELLNTAWPGGTTCLATLALLTSGMPANDVVIQRALPYIRGLKPELTYIQALQTMVLAEIGEAKDLNIIQRNVNALLASRIYVDNGLLGWSYSKAGHHQADNSNTQYALLGLLAGRQAGVKIAAKDWAEIQKFYIDKQIVVKTMNPVGGGWSYQPDKDSSPSHTMTAAGLSGLFISGLEMNVGKQELDPQTGVAAKCGQYDENEAVARGMRWLGANFKFDMTKEPHKATFYNVYGIERVGRLSGQRFIGQFDWYREGCELLCGVQKNAELGQGDDGSWRAGQGYETMPVISTCFALLFLSKGRTPVLISKLAFDSKDGSHSDWNRKHHDARHLVDYASKTLFKKQPLAWQIFDPRLADIDGKEDKFQEELTSLLQSPILYMNGHAAPNLTPRQIELLRRYVDEGGFIFAEACCGDRAFREGFRILMEKVFKNESQLAPMRADHPIWSAHMPLNPKEFMAGRDPKDFVQCIERGCKTVVVFTPQPLAGFWEEAVYMPENNLPPTTRGELAYRFAGNVIAYATGLEMPKPRLTAVALSDRTEAKNVTRHVLKLAQIKHEGDWKPAPQAMHVLANYLVERYGLQVASMRQDDPDIRPSNWNELSQYKFMYMHGRRDFTFDENELANVRKNLLTGGLLFADACCGSKEFDKAFRAFVQQLYPRNKLERVPLDDFLYSERLNRRPISTVKCRPEKMDGAAAEYEDMPPELEGVKIGNRWVIIYSKYDIGCALEKSKSSACRGHDHESAKLLAAAAVLYWLNDVPKKSTEK